MRIKWLHLSDIHFNYKNFDSHSLREDFISQISQLSQTESFTHLFLTGDILFRNQQADSEAIAFIRTLIDTMNLPLENVIVVPGNHDHDRRVAIEQLSTLSSQDDTTIDNLDKTHFESMLAAFDKFDDVYADLFSSNYYPNYDNPHTICISSPITVIKLNTAWLDTNSSSEPDLRIGSRQLQLLLSSADEELQKSVNIAVGHHPLAEFAVCEKTRVLDLFKKHNIGIYFCGHTHRPNIKIHREHDVIEIVSSGGYIDDEGYSTGGYVMGIIDTDTNVYKAEVYIWDNGRWHIDSTLSETDTHGIFYFNTSHFPNSSDIVAIDCKTIGSHISRNQLDRSLGINNYDLHTYCGPHCDPNGFSMDTIQDLSDTILDLIEKGKTVHLYPLAPIPMLLSLGFCLQKNAPLIIHQYDRNSEKWVHNESEDHISTSYKTSFTNSNILVVVVSTAFKIESNLISAAMNGRCYDLIEFTTSQVKAGYPLYIGDIHNVVEAIISELNPLSSKYSEIHLFAAVPAGLAVELGRNLLSSVYHNVYTYQLSQGHYVQDLIINKVTSDRLPKPIPTQFTTENASVVYIPILGMVPCGPIKEAITESESYLPLPASILDNGNYYILIASGDSMIDAGIEDGDYVLVKQQVTAREGEIVVALIEGGTTIKRIHFDNDNKQIVLYPENSQYLPYSYKELNIQGVAVKVIKNL